MRGQCRSSLRSQRLLNPKGDAGRAIRSIKGWSNDSTKTTRTTKIYEHEGTGIMVTVRNTQCKPVRLTLRGTPTGMTTTSAPLSAFSRPHPEADSP